MERLTKNFNGAFGLVKVKDNEQEIESPYRNTLQACFESWQRLGQYEDTGLTPDEIAVLRAELGAFKAELHHVSRMTDEQFRGWVFDYVTGRAALEGGQQ